MWHTCKQKVGLEISFGQADQYYAELAKEAHLDVLEATIMKLNAQVGTQDRRCAPVLPGSARAPLFW